MAKEKEMILAYVIDEKGLKDAYDIHGILEKKPMRGSFVTVASDHKDIGGKLYVTDGVFENSEIEEAVKEYNKPKKKETKKKSDKKGNYDTKVMTPKK